MRHLEHPEAAPGWVYSPRFLRGDWQALRASGQEVETRYVQEGVGVPPVLRYSWAAGVFGATTAMTTAFSAMNMFRISRLMATVLVVLSWSASAQTAQSATANVDVIFTAPTALTLGEPVVLGFELRNRAGRRVSFDVGEDRITKFRFELTGPDARRQSIVPTAPDAYEILLDTEIPPGRSYRQSLLLNRWFDFSKPGRYAISATFNGAIGPGPSVVPGERTTQLVMDIQPRDEQRLRSVCADLDRTANANSGHATKQAAEALSYIRDDIAVPFLISVVTKKSWIGDGIRGLERVNTPAAIAALQRFAEDSHQETALFAEGALKRLGYKVELTVTVSSRVSRKRGG